MGWSSEENFQSALDGRSTLQRFEGVLGIPQPFFASLMDWNLVDDAFAQLTPKTGYSRFEKLAILSASYALKKTSFDVTSPRTIFIISTTKANVELLESDSETKRRLPSEAAQAIAAFFGHHHQPLVVSNACISGLHAQLSALRLLNAGLYDHAVVIGADVLGQFVVSGFQSFHALSADACHPFDCDRLGLNLGEAAATIVYERENVPFSDAQRAEIANTFSEPAHLQQEFPRWHVLCGAIRNDAFHISAPSRTATGAYYAIRAVMDRVRKSNLAFINAHGTATMYNDEMEGMAIARAGLQDIPTNSLKGYFGHTMGAAGVLETIISMKSIDHHTILGTRGYEEIGVSSKIFIQREHAPTDRQMFLKLLSGFGGCNAAMVFYKDSLVPDNV